MKIIYFSRNMKQYEGASYQQDVIKELDRQHQVFFYGPGFPSYNEKDRIGDVIGKVPFRPDMLCIGHSWLSDTVSMEVNMHPNIDFSKTQLSKAMILNKEYVNLKEKLRYIIDNKIDIVFTHHHDIKKYDKETGSKFIFWPFAVDHNRFKDYRLKKEYDLFFTGILQNPNFPELQSDARLRVMKKLFYCIGTRRLCKKLKYIKYKFFWRSFPMDKKIDTSKYPKYFNQSKICFTAVIDDMQREVETTYAFHFFGKENMFKLINNKIGFFTKK